MLIIVQRMTEHRGATIGMLAFEGEHAECFTLEDSRPLDKKVAGSTRIPAGLYQVELRNAGGMYERYRKRFDWHRGMLELQDVPGFEYIYIHPGNRISDTSGCILVGDGALMVGELVHSQNAYRRVYTRALGVLEAGKRLYIEVRDEWNFTS